MKIYYYLAFGRAILATDIVLHGQVLDERSAWLAPPPPAGFAGGLTRLARDPDLRARLGERASRIAREHYSFEAIERCLASAHRMPGAPAQPASS